MTDPDHAVSDQRVQRQVRNATEPILQVYYRYIFGDWFLAEHIDPGDRVLDVGTGAGRSLLQTSDLTDDIYGVDLSPEAASVATALFGDRGGQFAVADGGRLPFRDGTFDVVQAAGFLPHFSDVSPYIEEFARVLRPGGRAVFNVKNEDTFVRHKLKPFHESRSLSRVVEAADAAGFEVVAVEPTFVMSRKQKMLVFSQRMPMALRWAGLVVSIFINAVARRIPRVRDGAALYWVLAEKRADPA